MDFLCFAFFKLSLPFGNFNINSCLLFQMPNKCLQCTTQLSQVHLKSFIFQLQALKNVAVKVKEGFAKSKNCLV